MNYERERRKAQKVKNCMAGSMSLGALSCELDKLRRGLEAGKEWDNWDARKVVSLANDVRKAFGGKSRAAIEMADTLKKTEETSLPKAALDLLKKAQEALPNVMASASDDCGKALRPPAVRKPKEAVQPPPEAAETP